MSQNQSRIYHGATGTKAPVPPQINEQMLLQIIFENKKVRARTCLE
jgi:hypothetical protein